MLFHKFTTYKFTVSSIAYSHLDTFGAYTSRLFCKKTKIRYVFNGFVMLENVQIYMHCLEYQKIANFSHSVAKKMEICYFKLFSYFMFLGCFIIRKD